MAGAKKKRAKATRKKKCRSKKALDNSWYTELREEEKGTNEDGKEFVYFAGLCRLAEEAGKVSESISHKYTEVLSFETQNRYNIIVSVSVSVTFNDNTTWIGSADAHIGNCCPGFKQYPTALAETRALARAYRRALGIYVVSNEELTDIEEGVMTGEANSQQLALIRKHAKSLDLDHIEIIKKVSTRDGISAIDQLNYDEAQEACKQLNDLVADQNKKKKQAAKKKEKKDG